MLRLRAPLLLTTTLVVAALAAAGCGSSNDDEGSGSASTSTPATTSTPTTTMMTTTLPPAPDESSAPAVSNAANLDEKPQIARPQGSPPATLITKDLVVGKGPAAASGDTVTVQYVGKSFSNGEEFDASWGKGEPLTIPLGQGQVIQGWDQGIVGMQVGGRRELVIPPDLGYGASGQGSILPNETLVFVVDLKKIG